MRASTPADDRAVTWVEMDDEPGYWAVLRHADVVHVAKHSEIFSATEGGSSSKPRPGRARDHARHALGDGSPRHTAYRKPVAPEFKAQVIAELDGRVREVVRGIFDHADQSGPDVEFVHDVCAHLPSQILGEIMGLPAEDWPAIHAMAERNSGSQDPDVSDGKNAAPPASKWRCTQCSSPPTGGRQVPRGPHRRPAR